MTQIHVLDAKTDDILEVLTRPYWGDVHTQNLETNVEYFDFTTIPEAPAAQYLRERNRLIIPAEDGTYREFIIDEHIQELDSLSVYSTASYLELAKAKPFPPGVYEGETPKTALEFILAETEWQPGQSEYAATADLEFEGYTSPLAALRMAAELMDRELRFRVETEGNRVTGRYVDLIEHIGEWRGREITSGKDLINARRTENTEQVTTALIGLGPQTNDSNRIVVEVTDADARQRWGRSDQHLWATYEPSFDSLSAEDVTSEDVRQATEEELQRRINAVVQYEIEATDAEAIFNRPQEQIRLGDNIRIKATEYEPPLYMDARVIEIERSIQDASEKTFTLGEFIEYSAAEIESLREEFRKKFEQVNGIHYGPQPPADTSKLWIDTSYEPYRVMAYSYVEELWKRATPINPIEVGAEIKTHKGVNPPEDKDKLWIDTSTEPNVLKQYDYTQARWVKITPTEAEEVNATTPEHAQNISESERYRGHLMEIERKDDEIQALYTKYAGDPAISGNSTLVPAMTDYNNAYQNLHASIASAVSDTEITQSEKDEMEGLTVVYRSTLTDLLVEFDKARDQIAGYEAYQAEQNATDFTTTYAQKEITQGSAQPSNPVTGDLWIDTSSYPYVWKQYNNGWQKISRTNLAELTGTITETQVEDEFIKSPMIAANAITSTHISANTITSNMISTAGLDAGVINTENLTANAVETKDGPYTLSLVDSNVYGGLMQVYDSTGNLNAKIGVEGGGGGNRAGTLILYDDGEDRSRVELGIGEDYGSGTMIMRDSAGNGSLYMSAYDPSIGDSVIGLAVDIRDGLQTYMTLEEIVVGGQQVATESYVRSNFAYDDHTHSEYALTGHTHSEYAEKNDGSSAYYGDNYVLMDGGSGSSFQYMQYETVSVYVSNGVGDSTFYWNSNFSSLDFAMATVQDASDFTVGVYDADTNGGTIYLKHRDLDSTYDGYITVQVLGGGTR